MTDLPGAGPSTQEVTDFVVGAGVAFLCAWGLYRLFVARETYFVWILPLFLISMFVGAFAVSGGPQPLPLGALAGLIAGGIVLGQRSWQLQRVQQAKLESFARELGLSFTRNDQTYAIEAGTLVDDMGTCFNVLHGSWHGVPVALFDYQYMDYSDLEAPAMIVLTCAVSTLDRPEPRMIIRGHRLGDKVKKAFGSKSGLLGDDAFDRVFRVETADLERAKDILRPRTREWLLANARGAKVLVDGTTLMLCAGHQTMKQLPELLERIRALRATFT